MILLLNSTLYTEGQPFARFSSNLKAALWLRARRTPGLAPPLPVMSAGEKLAACVLVALGLVVTVLFCLSLSRLTGM